MSRFESAFRLLMHYETGGDDTGAYHDDSGDPGGPTRWGIAARYHPGVNIKTLTRSEAAAIYQRDYWFRYRCGELVDQQVATVYLFAVVNPGPRRAGRALQRACRAVRSAACRWDLPIPEVDGLVGPITITVANALPSLALAAALRSEVDAEFTAEVLEDPGDAVFANGWRRRAMLDGLPAQLEAELCNNEAAIEAAVAAVRIGPIPGEPGSEIEP